MPVNDPHRDDYVLLFDAGATSIKKRFYKITTFVIINDSRTAPSRSNDEPVHFCTECAEKFSKFMKGEIGEEDNNEK